MGRFSRHLKNQNLSNDGMQEKQKEELKVIISEVKKSQRKFIELSNQIRKNISIPINSIKTFKDEFWEDYFKEFGWIDFIPAIFAIELSKLLAEEGQIKVWEELIDLIKGEKAKKLFYKEYPSLKFISKRLKIIEEAFENHEKENYLVSIPLFLTQIEGIVWDIGVSKGLVDKDESRYKIDSNGERVKDKNGEDIPWQTSDLIIKLFKDSTCKIHRKGTEIYSVKFRHPILHGRDANYYDLPKSKEREATLILFLFVLLGKIKEEKL